MLTISPAQRPGDFEGDNSLISTANIRSPLLQVIAWQPVNPDLHVHLYVILFYRVITLGIYIHFYQINGSIRTIFKFLFWYMYLRCVFWIVSTVLSKKDQNDH